MPHGATALGGSELFLLGIIAFVTVLVSTSVAYGLWVLRRRARTRSIRKNEHILDPPPRPSISDPAALELGNSFRKNDRNEHDPYVLLPHNLASYLPSTPPHAHVSGSSPLSPPGLPPCKDSDSAKAPVLVITNTSRSHRSVEVVFEHTATLTSPRQVQSHYSPVIRESGSFSEIETAHGDSIPSHDSRRLSEEGDEDTFNRSFYSDGEEASSIERETSISQDSGMNVYPNPTHSAGSSSPFHTQILPTLVITSPSIQRGQFLEKIESETHLPSPPTTPTLVLTSPSIHCGLDSDPEERVGHWKCDFQNWSDILELEDYEDSAKGPRGGGPSVEIPKQLETPPQTPKFLQMPAPRSCVLSSPASVDESKLLVLHPAEGPPERAQLGDEEGEMPLDYATFHARLTAFHLTHKRVKIEDPSPVKELPDEPSVPSSSSSQTIGFNYERLLARRRGTTVSSKSPSANLQSLKIQVPAPAQCIAKPRPRPLTPRRGYI